MRAPIPRSVWLPSVQQPALTLPANSSKLMAGVNLTHVPYRGSAPAVSDLIGGQVQVMFDTVVTSLPHVCSGALRPLAVAQSSRFDLLPDVPTVSETLPGFETAGFVGVAVRGETSHEIVESSIAK